MTRLKGNGALANGSVNARFNKTFVMIAKKTGWGWLVSGDELTEIGWVTYR